MYIVQTFIDFPFYIQCELIALLEDDTGMELLVCNKIMSLNLPVLDVYRKVSESKLKPSFRRTHPIVMICRSCLSENNEGEPMRIVYRMRGQLEDATEEFIERFDDKHQRPANDEETSPEPLFDVWKRKPWRSVFAILHVRRRSSLAVGSFSQQQRLN